MAPPDAARSAAPVGRLKENYALTKWDETSLDYLLSVGYDSTCRVLPSLKLSCSAPVQIVAPVIMDATDHNYWLVGASWRGTDLQDKRFTEEGFWMLGWESGNQPEKASEIKAGDRIAIKRMKGKGQTGIRIMHIGVVKGVILDTSRIICTVDWCATNLKRDILQSRGCFKSIHGPYSMQADGSWLRSIFYL